MDKKKIYTEKLKYWKDELKNANSKERKMHCKEMILKYKGRVKNSEYFAGY